MYNQQSNPQSGQTDPRIKLENKKVFQNEAPIELKPLKPRSEPIDLDGDLNKIRIVNATGAGAGRPGFYCGACDLTFMDSLNYLDHINGARHQQKLGISTVVERSTPQQVRERILHFKRLKDAPKIEETLEERVNKAMAEEEQAKLMRKKEKKERKLKKRQEEEEENANFIDNECIEVMGFGGFGTSK